MKSKFDALLESYGRQLLEQEATLGGEMPPADGATTGGGLPQDTVGGTPAAQPQAPKTVSQGYAYNTELIYRLFKAIPSQDVLGKYGQLSDNKASTPEEAFKYMEILRELLTGNTKTEVQTANHGKSKNAAAIGVDDSMMMEMANTAIKAYFFSPKDNMEFVSRLNNIEDMLAKGGNKITVDNANAIYTEIKDTVSMEE